MKNNRTESRPAALRRHVGRLLTKGRRIPPAAARPRPVPVPEMAAPTGTSIRADRVIRGAAITILLAVAGAAAYVSYHHFYGLAIALGERADMAILYPAMSDGVIVMASLVMVYCSRRGIPVPVGAWAALTLGCAVTLVANVAHGWSGGHGSRLLSALAPVAFVGAYELLMWLVRTARRAAAVTQETPVQQLAAEHVCQPETVVETVTVVERVVPVDRFEAARLAYEDSLRPGGKRLGWRPLSNRWGIEVGEAKEIIAEVDRERAPAPDPEAEKPAPEMPPVPVDDASAPGAFEREADEVMAMLREPAAVIAPLSVNGSGPAALTGSAGGA